MNEIVSDSIVSKEDPTTEGGVGYFLPLTIWRIKVANFPGPIFLRSYLGLPRKTGQGPT